jgi:hypothetical protein
MIRHKKVFKKNRNHTSQIILSPILLQDNIFQEKNKIKKLVYLPFTGTSGYRKMAGE